MTDGATTTGQRRKPRREPAPTTPDPVEIAMEAEAGDTSPDSPARRLLIKQERLVERQTQLTGWQIASERAGFALKLLTGLAGVGAAMALGVMVWQAGQADGLVIKPFSVPPELTQKGITGEALASQMLDQLSRMSAVARSGEQQGRVAADWGSSVSIEIPQTGVSLSQVDQWLRDKLGRQRLVTVELMGLSDGRLMLVSRLGAEPLPPQIGTADEVPALVVRAAETLYGRQQPISYWQYLNRNGRVAEAEAVSRAMARSADRTTRAVGYSTLGNIFEETQGDAAAAAAYERARAIEPAASPSATENPGLLELKRGRLERAAALLRAVPDLVDRSPGRTGLWRRAVHFDVQSILSQINGDHQGALSAVQGLAATGGEGARLSARAFEMLVAEYRAPTHDILTARAEIAAFEPATAVEAAQRRDAELATALAAQDWVSAVPLAEALVAAKQIRPDRGVLRWDRDAKLAQALIGAGRLPEANAVLAPTPLDCQTCVMARGQLAEAQGERALADHWFREGIRIAPSWAAPQVAYGRVMLARGDTAATLHRARAALRIGPRSADALQLAGEALLIQGAAKDATANFARAAALTPKWGRLHLKWGEALASVGKAVQARAHFRLASTLYLTPAEREELATVAGKRTS